jgi:hypothetical protein
MSPQTQVLVTGLGGLHVIPNPLSMTLGALKDWSEALGIWVSSFRGLALYM